MALVLVQGLAEELVQVLVEKLELAQALLLLVHRLAQGMAQAWALDLSLVQVLVETLAVEWAALLLV